LDQVLEPSYRFCSALARREARNFYYAFLLLPKARKLSMCALYAFLRHTDDLADEPGPAPRKISALHDWRLELDAALAGRGTAWPGLPALADTLARHGIPAQLLHEVIEGVSTDILPRRFATFDELAGYCYQVASVVGLCCLYIWGYRSEGGRAERLAVDCGIALQLTNIIRDVRDDAGNGRIYLPEDDLLRFGVEPEELCAGGRPSDRVRALLAFEGKRAYQFYENAQKLIPLVDPVGRPVLLTIVGIYRALLDEITRRDHNVSGGRISLSPWRKLTIALRALAARGTAFDSRAAGTADPHTFRDKIAPPL
jgi:phytoene synthase